jgi:hypothetical protein
MNKFNEEEAVDKIICCEIKLNMKIIIITIGRKAFRTVLLRATLSNLVAFRGYVINFEARINKFSKKLCNLTNICLTPR